MSKPFIKIHNVATDEIVEREMNDAEYDQHLKNLAESQTQKEAFELMNAKKAAALDKLKSLGLEIDDLRALGLG